MYIILIRHHCFIEAQPNVSVSVSWLHQNILNFFPSILLQNIIAIIVLWIQSIFINTIASTHKLGRETTLFAGLFYVLLISLSKESLALSPVLSANLFLIIGIFNIVESTKQVDIRHYLFNSGFFLTIAGLIYPPYLFTILFGFIGFYAMKPLKSFGNIQYLAGVSASYILVFGIQYLVSGTIQHNFAFQFIQLSFLKNIISQQLVILISVYIVILIFVFLQYTDLMSKKSILTRKKIELFYVLMLFYGIAALLFYNNDSMDMFMMALPLGTLFGLRISEFKSVTTSEIIHLLLLACLIFIQYNILIL